MWLHTKVHCLYFEVIRLISFKEVTPGLIQRSFAGVPVCPVDRYEDIGVGTTAELVASLNRDGVLYTAQLCTFSFT